MSTPFQYYDLSAKRSPAAAFTLIELLTVIAIIAVLAAILIPAVGRVRASANTANCASNMRQLSQALILCSQERGGQIPDRNPRWDVAALEMMSPSSGDTPYSNILRCPSDEVVRSTVNPLEIRSYSINPALINYNGQFGTSWGENPPPPNTGMMFAQLQNPAMTALLVERHAPQNAFDEGGWMASGSIIPAHGSTMNVAYCDGHVAQVDAEMDQTEFRQRHMFRTPVRASE